MLVAASALLLGMPVAAASAASSAAAGTGWIRLAHLSPNTPAVDVYLYSFGNSDAKIVLHHVAYGTVSPYQAIPANTWTMQAIGSGSTATARFNMAAGTVHTMVVLDGASGLQIVNLEDAAGAGQPPAGGVTTGFGGTAGHGPGSPAPWLAVIGAGALVAVTGGIRLRRRQMNTGI